MLYPFSESFHQQKVSILLMFSHSIETAQTEGINDLFISKYNGPFLVFILPDTFDPIYNLQGRKKLLPSILLDSPVWDLVNQIDKAD